MWLKLLEGSSTYSQLQLELMLKVLELPTTTIRSDHTRNISQHNCVVKVVIEKTHRAKLSGYTSSGGYFFAEPMMDNVL